MEKTEITFYLNGRKVSISADPMQRTVDFLRSNLHLTGTKEGCGDGDCGACTVALGSWEDGTFVYRAVASCILPVAKLQGKSLVTVEGLASMGALNCIQEAIIDTHGAQCGFCSPGFIMSFFALFAMNAVPTIEDVEIALQGNICRCTGYEGIKSAALKMIGYQGKAQFVPDQVRECEQMVRALSQKVESKHYTTPTDTTELLQALHTRKDATLVSGLTDLAVAYHTKGSKPTSIIDLSQLQDSKKIFFDANGLHLGAAVPLQRMVSDEKVLAHLPEFAKLEKLMASKQIRNVATVGGNIANASPIGDSLVLLAAADAVVVSIDPQGSMHKRPLRSFYTAYKQTIMSEHEVILEVLVPHLPSISSLTFQKTGKRSAVDIATVNSASLMGRSGKIIERWELCFGGVGPTIILLDLGKEQLDVDAPITAIKKLATRCAESMNPISDVRGSACYRSRLVASHILYHFLVQTGKEDIL
jgi:xanthine dehydrogenase small subunit